MNSRQVLAGARLYQSQIRNASGNAAVGPRFEKLRTIQKKFGLDDGVPVYLKNGFGDSLLFKASCGLTVIGLGLGLETFYKVCTKSG